MLAAVEAVRRQIDREGARAVAISLLVQVAAVLVRDAGGQGLAVDEHAQRHALIRGGRLKGPTPYLAALHIIEVAERVSANQILADATQDANQPRPEPSHDAER